MLRIRSCLSVWTKPIRCEKVWMELADWSKTICSNKSGHLCVCTWMSVSVWFVWNRIWKLWLTRHFLEVEFERNCPRGFFWESNSTLHWLFVWIFHATAIQKNSRVTQDFVSLPVAFKQPNWRSTSESEQHPIWIRDWLKVNYFFLFWSCQQSCILTFEKG